MLVSTKTLASETDSSMTFGANVSSFTLENGLKVVVVPDHRTPVATHMIWYKVGGADEPEGKSGIAHFLEHLMFKGTTNFPGSTFSDTVARLGGTENAFTSQDYTAYFQRIAREHLPRVMEMEADRMSNLVLSDDVVLPERDVVLEERRQVVDNNPSAQLGELMNKETYAVHPYGIPIIGWQEEIEGLTKEDALEFYARFYTPSNAILIIAGDVTEEDVRALVADTYALVEDRVSVPPRQRPQEPRRDASAHVEFASENVGLESLRITFPTPSYATAEPGEGAVLDVLSEVLGTGVTSFLYQELVVRQAVAASAGSYYQGSSYDPSRIMLYGSPADGVSLEELEAAMLEAIERFKTEPLDEEDVARAKTSLIAQAIYAQDNQSSLARIYGVALTTGQSIDDVHSWPVEVEAVTPDQVIEAARKYFDVSQSVTGYLRRAEPEAQNGGGGS